MQSTEPALRNSDQTLSALSETPNSAMLAIGKQVAAGYKHTMILQINGSLWACGNNYRGELGTGNTTNQITQVQIMSSGVQSVAAGEAHTMIVKTDGTLWVCGSNFYGQLGIGNRTDQYTPIRIMSSVVKSVAGNRLTLILKTDGSLWTCGQLSDGYQRIDQFSPVKIMSSGVKSVAAGDHHSLIVTTNGSLWAFGENRYGEFGNGSTSGQITPVKIMSSGVRSVAAGDAEFSLIVKTDESLWACGRNDLGQLGNGNTIDQHRPVQIMSSGVQSVIAGNGNTLILKTDGSLWTCGRNDFGQLGNGNTIEQHRPVKILSSGVQSITAGDYHSLIVKNDGSIWACGWNAYGQLGDGTTTNKLVLTKIMSAPLVTTQPINKTCPVNSSVTFTIAASGASLSYQWQKNCMDIVGATSASYTPPALTVADILTASTYRCIVKNSWGTATSTGATLAVSTLTDINGNVYHQVKIGKQIWTMENLRSIKYNDNTAVHIYSVDSSWTMPAYCYNNNTTNADSVKKFGALYNWYVVSPTNVHKIAPTGWHVPSSAEWDTLQNYLIANRYNWDGTTTGNKIAKSMAAKTDWELATWPKGAIGNNLAINNRSGFSAIPGGCRFSVDMRFYGNGYWWSSTEFEAGYAWYRSLYSISDGLDFYSDPNNDVMYDWTNKRCFYSVRLVKD